MKNPLLLALAVLAFVPLKAQDGSEIQNLTSWTNTDYQLTSTEAFVFDQTSFDANFKYSAAPAHKSVKYYGFFEEGTSIVTLGYGFPNLQKVVFKTTVLVGLSETYGGTGPLHLRYEYGITDKIGAGVSINYAAANHEFDSDTFRQKDSWTTFSILARINWHFTDDDKVDFYAGFGVGYNKHIFKSTSNDPNFDESQEVADLNTVFNLIPIGFETVLGLRYLFSDYIGAYMEAGFAKSLISFGIVAKLY